MAKWKALEKGLWKATDGGVTLYLEDCKHQGWCVQEAKHKLFTGQGWTKEEAIDDFQAKAMKAANAMSELAYVAGRVVCFDEAE